MISDERAFDRLRLLAASLLLVLATGFDPLQSIYRFNESGLEALQEQDPEQAIAAFSEALTRVPDDPVLNFNLGNALAAAGRLEEAQTAWSRAAEMGQQTLSRDAWYNGGVAALQSGDAEQAVSRLSQALMLDPRDAQARRNLEIALRQLQQQEQEQSQQQDQQQQDQQDQQDQQQEQQQQNQQDQQDQQDQQQQDDSQKDRSGEQQTQPSESQPQPADGEQQQGAAPDPEKEMSERLLKMLDDQEREALQRALRRRAGQRAEREKDW